MIKPRCQLCGGTLRLSCNAAGEFIEGLCMVCDDIWWPAKAAQTRARKRFQLVMALSAAAISADPDAVKVTFKEVKAAADAILTEMYGEVGS